MEKPFICGGSKYTISATNTIGLPVLLEGLPKEISVNENKLFLKSFFHVSLVCINEIIKKYNILNPKFRDSVLEDFCEFTKTSDIKLLRYSDDFKYAEENNLKTVIILCEVSNLVKFFGILSKKYGLKIEYPPTHVTLYAHNGKTGIFLIDSNDIKNLTKSIPNPVGRLL